MKNNRMTAAVLAALLMLALCGCGKASEEQPASSVQENSNGIAAAALTPEPAEEPAAEPCPGAAKLLTELEPGQAYAALNEEYLLVAGDGFESDGKLHAIDATVYGPGAEGSLVEYGSVHSQGTAYPIASSGDLLFSGGGHWAARTRIDRESAALITEAEASEVFQDGGAVTYWYYSEEIDEEAVEVEDDRCLTELFDEYEKAEPVAFLLVQ